MNRRLFVQTAASALAAETKRGYKAVIIGHTGHGDYGHHWDTAFASFPSVTVMAVADADDAGRRKAKARSGALRDYRDYRQMLDREKPDLVVIAPRWLDQRLPMFTAAAEHGAHIVMEKPFAASLEEADQMVAAAEKNRVKVQVGHTARPHPVTRQVLRMVRDGVIGQLMEMRARGKEDRRAGGEDLIVLGTHCFDLMRFFAGDPQWVFAHISENDADIGRKSARQGTEPLGPLAGTNVIAMFAFGKGIHGYFGSQANDVKSGARFGIVLHGSQGAIAVPLTAVPSEPAVMLSGAAWGMDSKGTSWKRIPPPPEPSGERESANAMMVADLLGAIEKNREPACSAHDGRWTIEMVTGVYQSQFRNGRVDFPLRDRRNPLA